MSPSHVRNPPSPGASPPRSDAPTSELAPTRFERRVWHLATSSGRLHDPSGAGLELQYPLQLGNQSQVARQPARSRHRDQISSRRNRGPQPATEMLDSRTGTQRGITTRNSLGRSD